MISGRFFGSRPTGQRDQRDIALSCSDGFSSMRDVHHVGGAAGVGRIDVTRIEAHVIGHADGIHDARRIAGAEITVHILDGQPCILQGAFCALGVQQRHRFVVGLARGMLESPRDIGLSFNGHFLVISRSDIVSVARIRPGHGRSHAGGLLLSDSGTLLVQPVFRRQF